MWFEKLTGFAEESPEQVRENLELVAGTLTSKVNKRKFKVGSLQISSLIELKNGSPPKEIFKDKLQAQEIVANVLDLHCDLSNKQAIFQAASQFNLLEMINPEIIPEQGIARYEYDHTQGPACAIACGAGTIYRNYFVELGDQIGQTKQRQIDCLALIAHELNNEALDLWEMKNGYALVKQKGLLAINKIIAHLSPDQRNALKGKLKIGLQWNTEVTLSKTKHLVSQAYCSALPVAYGYTEPMYWEYFARLILEASYEATLYAALINYEKTNCKLVYLTLLGGGAFGNESDWILESLQQALRKFKRTPLDVKVVSYGKSNEELVKCLADL